MRFCVFMKNLRVTNKYTQYSTEVIDVPVKKRMCLLSFHISSSPAGSVLAAQTMLRYHFLSVNAAFSNSFGTRPASPKKRETGGEMSMRSRAQDRCSSSLALVMAT